MKIPSLPPIRAGESVNILGDSIPGKVTSIVNMDRWVPSIEVKFKDQDYSKSISPGLLYKNL